MDGGDNPEAAEAAGTFENVQGEDAAHQLGPGVVARQVTRQSLAIMTRGVALADENVIECDYPL